jgi:hypothetical protein
MERQNFKLVVDDITLMDILVFEKAVGTKLMDALSPRLLKDPETGQPIMAPEDPDDPESRLRPVRAISMSTEELLGAVMVARRQADRDNEKKFTKLDDVGRLKLSEIFIEVDWGTEEDSGNPTSPEAASTESS